VNLNNLTKRFILTEGQAPTINSWLQGLTDNIKSLRPSTVTDSRRVEVIKHQITELRRCSRRMQEEINGLKEQVLLLQENKSDEKKEINS